MKINNGVLLNVRDEDIDLLVTNPNKFFKGIYKIGKEAFRDVNVKKLYDIVIPGSVSIIDDFAFEQCEWIRNVKFEPGITLIGKKAFSECTKLEKIIIPDGVKVIQEEAFYSCENVRQIVIGKGDINIDEYAFYGNYKSIETIHINGNIKGIGNKVIFDCCRNEVAITFGEDVEEIGSLLLGERNDVRELIIPSNVTDINESAFSSVSKLKKVTFNEGIEYIGKNAFSSCTALYRLKIPSSLRAIDKAAFSCCLDLRELIIEDGEKKSIGQEAFSMCSSLRRLIIPKCVETVDDSAFYCCTDLNYLNIEEGVAHIGREAFRYCSSLTYVRIPNSVTMVKELVFANCDKLESVMLSKNMLDIEEGMFLGCKNLKRITIPEGVKYIRKEAFKDCTSLEEILLPNSIVSIDENVFCGCKSLKKVLVGDDIKRIHPTAFANCPNLQDMFIPNRAKENLNYKPVKEENNEVDTDNENGEFIADFEKFEEIFKNIYGQDKAIEIVKKSLLRSVLLHSAVDVSKNNLEKRKGPLATFMFYGPTGTGKTEMSKRIAKFMFNNSDKLLVLDMNTYKDPKLAVSSIKGHPEGYIDSSKGTDFTRFLTKNQSGVIVLDEFEKANPEVREIFMTMLDEGKFKDSLGNNYDLSNYVFIATTNISKAFEGQQSSKKIGFAFDELEQKKENEERIKNILREEFTAPIMNRFNNLVPFEKIDRKTAIEIAENLIENLCKNIEGKRFRGNIEPKIIIENRDEIMDLILENSNYTKDGARSIKNVIEDIILSPILQSIASLKGNITLKIANGKISVTENKTRINI